ncbi:MAG: hypothetical protein HC942_24115 [Microcoleus sp. SU_5_6]|nr:hypothetical protein [Microcoleus sp. SU_5_6]
MRKTLLKEEGRGKKEEGRRKREEGRRESRFIPKDIGISKVRNAHLQFDRTMTNSRCQLSTVNCQLFIYVG